MRQHEALHTIGDPPRKGFVCPSCDSLHDTADAAWACAATHGVEHDNKRCLWDGCGQSFGTKQVYLRHESKHTGIWAHHCPTCGEGMQSKAHADGHCVIGAGCLCGWVAYANKGALLAPPHSTTPPLTPRSPPTLLSHASHPCSLAGSNQKKLAAHLKRCREQGGPATEDKLAIDQVKRRRTFEGQAASGGA